MVDHHRKTARNAADTDPVDDIFGSTAKAGVLDCAEDTGSDQPIGLPADPAGDEPQSFLYAPTSHDWLLDRMRTLADLFDTDQFYDGYMEHYKEEHGCFPKDSARTFAHITDRCRCEIQEKRDRGFPPSALAT